MRRDAFRHWITVPVRWGDMDAYGHVNNAVYFTYCESARIAYFEASALDEHRAAVEHAPAVVSASCDFLRQVHYPATLEVGVRASEIGRSSFTLEYGIYHRGTEDPVAEGRSVVVWVDYVAGKSIPLPESLKARIRQLDSLE